MTRKQLLKSKEYWVTQIQMDMYGTVGSYMYDHNLTVETTATKLGISKYRVRQILAGDYTGTIEEMVHTLLACGKVPIVTIENLKDQK